MGKELSVLPQVENGQVTVWEDVPEELLSGDGFENGGMDDLVVPRVLLAQALSPAVKKNSEVYIEGLSQGDFFNNVTRKIYGPGIRVIPVLFTKNRILFQGKDMDCRSENGVDGGHHAVKCTACEYSQWGTGKDGKGTACTEFRNFICYVPEEHDFAIISFKKATAQVGKLFYTTTTAQKRTVVISGQKRQIQLPIYGCEYLLTSKEKGSDSESFFTIAFDKINDVTDRELITHLKQSHDRFKSVNIVATEEAE